jgi:Methylase involved in ubiquinone/menaquinone biosynthesis
MDIVSHNREAWESEVAQGNTWTIPVDHATVEAARRGDWSIYLTPSISVPRAWFGKLPGARVLCLASGGGQQGPILAAAGAIVTVFDNCPAQLGQDRLVAEREKLEIATVQGDMRDLSTFADASFDLIVHPVSNCFVDDIAPVWRECARVLVSGGRLLVGFCNPLNYIFDPEAWDRGKLEVRYSIPYSDLEQRPVEELERIRREKRPLEFGHSLDAQIGGQIAAGFSIAGLYEDRRPRELLDERIATFIATLALKPEREILGA